ncbi:MAG TPA: M20/M25/M40 family metallo-hydrolase [Gaiellaceae bacterium]
MELVQREAGVGAPAGARFWTDAALVAAAGIPTVLFGPIGEGAHAEVEWVDLASLQRLHDVVVRVVRAWCG